MTWLNDAKSHAGVLLKEALEKLRSEEEKLKPFRDAVEQLASCEMNVSCRLNVWWGEYREAGGL